MVVETHAVDDALVFGNAEEARLRVAGLRFGRYRADFDETKAERAQCVDVFAVFVESSGKSDRVGQIHTHQFYRFGTVAGYGNQTQFINRVERVEREVVGFFGIECKQDAAGKWIHDRAFCFRWKCRHFNRNPAKHTAHRSNLNDKTRRTQKCTNRQILI